MFGAKEAGIVPERPSGGGLPAPTQSSPVEAAAEQVGRRTLASPMLVELLKSISRRLAPKVSAAAPVHRGESGVNLPEHGVLKN